MKSVLFFPVFFFSLLDFVYSNKLNGGNSLNFVNSFSPSFKKSTRSIKATTAYKIDNRPIRGPLIPLNEFVLVEKNEAVDTTDTGVFIGDMLKKDQYVGKVLSIGRGAVNPRNGERIPIDLEVNDIVLFNPSDGNRVKYNDKECILISNEEILGKLKTSTDDINPNNIIPLYDRVLIKLVKSQTGYDSLVYIPESKNEEKCNEGVVIEVGDGLYDDQNKKIPIDVNRDDFIKFSPFSNESCEFTYKNEKYTFVKARFIMAKY